MKNSLSLLSTATLIIASGVVHGFLIDRWKDPEDIKKAINALQNFPKSLDGWDGEILSREPEKESGLAATVLVKYKHRLTGKEVTVFLGCGRPGKVSVHTPDVCYATSGFEVETQSTESFSIAPDLAPSKVFTARFKKAKGGEQTLLQIFWTWYVDGKWTVSENPRFQYHGQKVLYKLYVIQDLDNFYGQRNSEICSELLPKLTRALKKSGTLGGK